MSAKKRVEDSESTTTDVNPFEADMSLGTPEFDLAALLEQCKTRMAENDKRKIGIQDRIGKAKENIARIQNMIDGLLLKANQESGQAWINLVVRPIVDELQKVFPNAAIDMSTVLSGAVTVTVCRKGVNQAGKLKNLDCKSVTFVPAEDGVALKDYSRDSGEFPPGSVGAIAGLGHPLVAVPSESAIQFIVDWLLK